jgi:hypothetical protein
MLVKMPEFKVTGKPEDLIEWYKSLGWNPETHHLDPTKVGVNEEDDGKMCEALLKTVNDQDKASYVILWANYGPSPRKNVPQGHVILEEGWIFENTEKAD